MTINRILNGKELTLAPLGWLDTNSSPKLGSEIEKIEDITLLIFDFAGVEYISSAGLRQVAAAGKKTREIGAAFKIINAGTEVMSIFKLTGLDRKFDITGI